MYQYIIIFFYLIATGILYYKWDNFFYTKSLNYSKNHSSIFKNLSSYFLSFYLRLLSITIYTIPLIGLVFISQFLFDDLYRNNELLFIIAVCSLWFLSLIPIWYKYQLKLNIDDVNIGFRRKASKILALITGLSSGFFFLLAPMLFFRVISGIPMNARGVRYEIYFLLIGCGIGPCMAYIVFSFVLIKLGGFTQDEVEKLWSIY